MHILPHTNINDSKGLLCRTRNIRPNSFEYYNKETTQHNDLWLLDGSNVLCLINWVYSQKGRNVNGETISAACREIEVIRFLNFKSMRSELRGMYRMTDHGTSWVQLKDRKSEGAAFSILKMFLLLIKQIDITKQESGASVNVRFYRFNDFLLSPVFLVFLPTFYLLPASCIFFFVYRDILSQWTRILSMNKWVFFLKCSCLGIY